MAKKDPKELPVEEKLKNLFQLQTTLSGIDEKRALRGELPLEVRDLEDEMEGLHTRIEKIDQDIKEYQTAITQKKSDILEAQASLERYNKQLDTVANNREYDTLTKEIEFQTLEIELCNKKIKEAQLKVEEKQRDLDANRALLEDRQHALEEKRNELDEIMQETREEEGMLKEKEDRTGIASQFQTYPSRSTQRTGNRLCAAGCLWRLLQQDSAPEAVGREDAQEDYRLRVLRPYPYRSGTGGCEGGQACRRETEEAQDGTQEEGRRRRVNLFSIIRSDGRGRLRQNR